MSKKVSIAEHTKTTASHHTILTTIHSVLFPEYQNPIIRPIINHTTHHTCSSLFIRTPTHVTTHFSCLSSEHQNPIIRPITHKKLLFVIDRQVAWALKLIVNPTYRS